MHPSELSSTDRLVSLLDQGLRAVFAQPTAERANPATKYASDLDESERRHAAELMRVNRAGEVAAQALYAGQAFTAKRNGVRAAMQQAAQEEIDHLAWINQRLDELKARGSHLDPVWYLGSFTLGALAGLAGDRWSLGFVAETERQVSAHLERHLNRLPTNDRRSRAILEQMLIDESNHATDAVHAGASELPPIIKEAMRMTARVMTTTARWI